MLTPLKREEFDKYVDFIYALALDPARSGYPTYTDGIKTRADFVERSLRAFERENEEILLYVREGRTAGWIHYYFLSEDKYLDTCSFCIAEGMGDAIGEFTAFARERFTGYGLYLGFPGENTQAEEALEAGGFACIERDFNNVFDLDRYEPRQPDPDVVPVTRENFGLFRALHAGHEEMYWNSDRLLADMDNWRLQAVEKALRAFSTRGTCGQLSLNFAKFRENCPAVALRAPRRGTLGRQKVFFPTYMPPEKY